MKKWIRILVVVMVATLCLCSLPMAAGAASSSETPVADVSGKYRPTAAKAIEKLSGPVVAAQTQNLYVDPVTNTVANLYDADGNLISCTLSSDGHFYIIPLNDGTYHYVPTGK